MRVKTAKRCLFNDWTQKAVAEFLGFGEPSAYACAFCDHEGVPPTLAESATVRLHDRLRRSRSPTACDMASRLDGG
jgi:hypothetical protein